MMRVNGWAEKLDQVITEHRAMPFAWGSNDCALFCADCVLAITGTDYAANWRGRYASALGSVRLLNKAGGSLERVIDGLFEAIPQQFLQRGDIALFNVGNGETIGICLGAQIAAPGHGGLEFIPLRECRKGWRVCRR